MRQTVAVSLPAELASEIDAVAEREGSSRSEIVRDALRRYLAVRELQRLRESLVPFAEAAGIVSDDDVFRIVS